MLVNLNDVLLPARRGKYAVGLFDTVSLEMARGVIEAAEAQNSPVIIGTAEVLLPYAPLEELSYFLLPMAKKAAVPVVVHLDHGLTAEICHKALELGFSSIMYDCSTASYDENVRRVREMTGIAHAAGASIEAELGHVGDNEGSAEGSSHLEDPSAYYTQPSQAIDFVRQTGVDALAIAVGSAHGAYKLPPKLDFQRIREIAGSIPTPLVLHGGSGLTDDDFKMAIEAGISKVNIFTDINVKAIEEVLRSFSSVDRGIIDLIPHQVAAIREAVIEKMRLFGACAKGGGPGAHEREIRSIVEEVVKQIKGV
ncbi:MAG: ketose-bisphosphate aldolase [Lachnospiraceae bacterium]